MSSAPWNVTPKLSNLMSLDIGCIPNTPVHARASDARFASSSSLAQSSSED